MKPTLVTTVMIAVACQCVVSITDGAEVLPTRGLNEVRNDQVTLDGGFWGPRQKIHHNTTVPHALDCLERNGHVTNFDKAAGVFDGPLRGHHAFDSDIHKAMEGAMYSLQHQNDPILRQRVDGILDRILAAQQDDGYLISYYIVNGLDKKWDDMRLEHQMYNAGHFFEMAIEHQRLTGETKAMDAAKRFADHIDRTFGPGKRYDVGGHEEIELALIKLYRATGEPRYLELARFLLDERGHVHGTERKPYKFGPLVKPERLEGQTDAEYRRAVWHAGLRWRNGRMQDHKPLIEQLEATGHAVRAGYIYSAMADMARFTDAPDYERAVDHLWEDVVTRKMYVNGAVGTAQYGDEGFGDPYLLPNKTYCESCASIAHVFWQHRMALLKGQAKYADVMELALYNGVLAGIALSGDGFFYQNPLQSKGSTRSNWIGLACCPTNLARIIPQVGGLAYAQGKNQLVVNLFAAGEASFNMGHNGSVKLTQKTNYPWDGHVELTVASETITTFDLSIRIPGWALGRPVPSDLYRFSDAKVVPVTLTLNGKSITVTPGKDGYVHLKRSWNAGDIVELDMAMPIHRVYAHEKLEEDQGKVSLMRGPIVYCVEAADNPDGDVLRLALPRHTDLRAEHRAELLGGVTVLQGNGLDDRGRSVPLTAIPYYAWTNRKKGPMTIWLNETPIATSLKKAGKSPVKVFILAGQSNMQGQGVVAMDDPKDYNGGKGNLEYVMANSPLASMYRHLKDADGKWVVRADVWIRYKTQRQGLMSGGLTIGYTGYGGTSHIGPELQIGHVLGDEIENQILLIKTAWGGKSLTKDFRPPSSGGQVGPYYTQMLQEVQEGLNQLKRDFPNRKGAAYELAGFIWLQGWNDMFDPEGLNQYEENLVNLIKDVRVAWKTPDLPVIIGELGNGGPKAGKNMLAIRQAQAAAAAHTEFNGTVTFVSTTDFARPAEESPNTGHGHHWFGNSESYFLIGNALGKAMVAALQF